MTGERIRLPGKAAHPPKPKPRDEYAETLMSVMQLGRFVRRLRTGLSIRQAELAERAHVSRQWIVALEQGKPTLEVALVFRTLEALGFELWVSPYDPAPPWMLRACADAAARQKALAAGRRARRNTRRAKVREARLAKNEVWGEQYWKSKSGT